MDLMLLGSLTVILGFVIFVIIQIIRLHRNEKRTQGRGDALRGARAWGETAEEDEAPAGQRGPVMVGGARRAAVRRRQNLGANRRGGDAAGAPPIGGFGGDSDEEEGLEGEDYRDDIALSDGKVGKKKLAKLEAKAEKRAHAEAERQEREERKQREAEREEKRKLEQEKEKVAEKALEEEERKAREEKERQEHEEYLKLKEAFAVEEEGFNENETLESENMLQDFIDYIQRMKVVNMDELASHFKIRTQDVVERLKTLVADGTLTGVIDDRGKFIYISMEELMGVAKFINQRGRVSVQELAEYSNKLIRLEPEDASA